MTISEAKVGGLYRFAGNDGWFIYLGRAKETCNVAMHVGTGTWRLDQDHFVMVYAPNGLLQEAHADAYGSDIEIEEWSEIDYTHSSPT